MILFKADASTYWKVTRKAMHAFQHGPHNAKKHELVILCENRDPRRTLHKQVQYLAKLLKVRAAEPGELELRFPGVDAAARWNDVVELYWSKPLSRPFNLHEIPNFDAKSFATVQTFRQLPAADEDALLKFLLATNEDVVLDFINHATPD